MISWIINNWPGFLLVLSIRQQIANLFFAITAMQYEDISLTPLRLFRAPVRVCRSARSDRSRRSVLQILLPTRPPRVLSLYLSACSILSRNIVHLRAWGRKPTEPVSCSSTKPLGVLNIGRGSPPLVCCMALSIRILAIPDKMHLAGLQSFRGGFICWFRWP